MSDEVGLLRWFRRLPPHQQGLVSVVLVDRGLARISPRRRVAPGRQVRCYACPADRRVVWRTSEGGRPATRRAQVVAARHLRGHLDGTAGIASC